MKNLKFWRTALVATLVLTVMLSVTGGTIAWFTDSVESKANTIQAGNLDIELEYKKPGDKTWATVNETTELFDNSTLWEPGHTEVVALRIKNAGTLALKYDMKVKINSESASTNVYGEEFKLSDYLEVYNSAIQNDGDIGDMMVDLLINSGRNSINVADMNKSDFDMGLVNDNPNVATNLTLNQGQAVVTALVITMPTSVGNEANHKTGVAAPSITFGVELEATQATVESDSFDNQYDKDAPQWTGAFDTTWYTEADAAVTEYTLTTAEDLAGLAELVNSGNDFAGKTIKLGANLDLGDKEWNGIGDGAYVRSTEGEHKPAKYFKGIFDGQGHTVYNLKVNDATQSYAALFAVTQNATIKNVNVKNVDIKADACAAAIVAYAKTTTIENCHVSGDISIVADWAYVGGIAAYGYVKVSDCSVIADGTGILTTDQKNAVGGIVGWQNESAGGITNCEVENLNLTGWANVGSIVGLTGAGNTIANNSAENLRLTKTRVGGNPSIGLVSGGWVYNAKANTIFSNNSFDNIVLNGQNKAYDAANVLYGSAYYGETVTSCIEAENNVQTNITNNMTIYVAP